MILLRFRVNMLGVESLPKWGLQVECLGFKKAWKVVTWHERGKIQFHAPNEASCDPPGPPLLLPQPNRLMTSTMQRLVRFNVGHSEYQQHISNNIQDLKISPFHANVCPWWQKKGFDFTHCIWRPQAYLSVGPSGSQIKCRLAAYTNQTLNWHCKVVCCWHLLTGRKNLELASCLVVAIHLHFDFVATHTHKHPESHHSNITPC